MLDHIGLNVSDSKKSKAFYRAELAPLGYEIIKEVLGYAGFGARGKSDFWIYGGGATTPQVHVAFQGEDRARVREFYGGGW